MNLFEITTAFWGKDLEEEAILGYVVGKTADAAYDYINVKHRYGDWADCVAMTREDIIAAEGDFQTEYMGEFYDQKYGWRDLGFIAPEDIACLQHYGMVPKDPDSTPAETVETAKDEQS